jgi:hypothetical protein
MAPITSSRLDELASQLLIRMAEAYHPAYGMGSMTCTVYDTAWVAMVTKTMDGDTQWLFPSSFSYILSSQESSGGWSTGGTEIDAILSTLAALLALYKHRETPYQLAELSLDLGDRITKATNFLRDAMEKWDVEATDHVCFEVLVPSILRQLEAWGAKLDFKGKNLLLRIRDKKLARFDVSMLYGKKVMTILHSLEAFAGSDKLDFNRLAHHKVCGGSMMASPSSTAAYLMHCSTWDNEAEAYLRHVISACEGKGDGSFPSAFPSTLFETSWVHSFLSIPSYPC